MSDSPESAPKRDRETNGQFAAGNRGGPGNPFARQVAELRQEILDRLTGEKAGAIADTLIARAEGGDVAAARLLFQYALGKPAKAIEPDRVEVDEHHLRMESTVPLTEMVQMGYLTQAKLDEICTRTANGGAELTKLVGTSAWYAPGAAAEEPVYGRAYLPRKFKTGLGLPEDNSVDIHGQDLGLLTVTVPTGSGVARE